VGKGILQQAELGSQEIQKLMPSYGQASSANNAIVYYASLKEITIRSYFFVVKTCRLAFMHTVLSQDY